MLSVKEKLRQVYFPGLNGLRFIAAFLIIVVHIEQFKSFFGYKNIWKNPFINSVGGLSVSLFFVLSGFLITYLLLTEKKEFGYISIRQFYVRRILRIWPLYFLIVSLGLFLLPRISFLAVPLGEENVSGSFTVKSMLYFAMLPNVALILYPGFLFCSHAWSIGVEEQFYLIWPVILKFIKNYLLALLLIAFFFIGVLNVLYYVSYHFKDMISNRKIIQSLDFLISLFSSLRIGCMAIGGIGAWILFSGKTQALKIIYNKWVQIAALFTTIVFLFFGISLKYIHHEFYSVLFCILILNVSTNHNSVIKLENKLFNSLGKISYGLYMYHPVLIIASLAILKKYFNARFSDFTSNFSLYFLTLLSTIGLSSLSYYLFEVRFLKLKSLSSMVITGNNPILSLKNSRESKKAFSTPANMPESKHVKQRRKILILGGGSYVGRHLAARLGDKMIIATRHSSPVDNAKYFDALSMRLSEIIEEPNEISCAVILLGNTDPETCAQDAKKSYALNVDSIKRVIDYLRRQRIKPVFTSSDYVFDGEKGNYIEGDLPNPMLLYGRQKVEIEEYLKATCDDYIIIRMAKVFGSQVGDGTIFTNWLGVIERADTIRCATDQIFSPVYIDNVVDAITTLIANDCKGVFHVCGRRPFARIELLKILLAHANKYVSKTIKIIPCSIHDFELREKRPLNVSMIPDRLIKVTGMRLSDVEEVCKNIVKNKFEKA